MALLLIIAVGAVIVALGIALAPYILPFLGGALALVAVACMWLLKWAALPLVSLALPSLLLWYVGTWSFSTVGVLLEARGRNGHAARLFALAESQQFVRASAILGAPFGVWYAIWVLGEIQAGRIFTWW